MRIKDLINQLQELYDSYDAEYHTIMGEPEIMVDSFKESEVINGYFTYCGFGNDIKIEKTDDGVYDIISAFQREEK